MLGLLVIIVVSWMLLHFIEKKNINVLGIIPNRKRSVQFLIGYLFIFVLLLLMTFIETFILSIKWELKPAINYQSILNAFVYHLRSALTEDLVFRGAILYILIQKIGSQKAILLSALCFGFYHVFSYEMLESNIVPIMYVILITGYTGYVWAYTFAKTKSIMMALGFHLGYNFVTTLFYTTQPFGELLFTEISRVNLSEWNSFYYSLFRGFFPSIITFIFVKQYLRTNLNRLKKE